MRARLFVVLVVAISQMPCLALAQANDFKQTILRLYAEGTKLYSMKAYDSALSKFRTAAKIIQQRIPQTNDPKKQLDLRRSLGTFYYIIGRTLQDSGQIAQAFFSYHKALTIGPLPVGTERKLRSYLAQITPLVLVPVSIRTTPPGASLRWVDSIGGVHVAQTPFQSRLPPGPGKLTLQLRGYQSIQNDVALQQNQPFSQHFYLRSPDSPAPQPAPAAPTNTKLILAFVTLGVAVAAGTGSAVMFGLSQPELELTEKNRPTNPTIAIEHYNTAVAYTTGSLVALGIAAIAGGFCVYFFVTQTPSTASSPSTTSSILPASSKELATLFELSP